MNLRCRSTTEVTRDVLLVTLGFVCLVTLIKGVEPYMTRSENDAIAKAMLTQTMKWLALSMQDSNACNSMQHATYASAYLSAARHVGSDTTLERLSGIDMHKLSRAIDTQQQTKVRELNKQCPKLRTRVPHGNGWLT